MMSASVGYTLLVVLICTACTQLERALPFLIFGSRPVPKIVRYLGKILPTAVMATLVVYCLRGISLASPMGFLPELAAVAVTALLHLWRRNTLLSIAAGTICYMLLT